MKILVFLFVSVILTFAQTQTSAITVDGNDYSLFTGFNAIKGVAGTNADPESSKMVDGDIESLWNVVLSLSGEYASVEFSSDYPIILRGFIVNLYNTTASRHPTELRLYAKASETDEYVEVSSYSVPSYLDMERTFPITKEDNTMYRYFKFECANSGRNMKLTEIRLYGYKEWAYTYLTPQEATCTQQGVLKECYRRTDGKYFADELGVTELTAEECVTPALPHEGVHHEEEANYIEYWQCSVCGHFFSDAKMTAEITEVQTQKISYMNSSGDLVQLNEVATKVTSDTTIWNAGWYLVSENVTISDRIIVNGEVHLILADGVTLNANRGITVSTDASFNIYAQTEDEANMGVLNATAPNHLGNPYAGIGCAYGSGDAGSITINGGKITVRGFIGAGIGSVQYRSVGTITINGGIIDALDTAGSGAGIGSGEYGKASVINLNGGVIYAKGIGAGQHGTGDITVNISDGIKKIIATSNNSGCIGNNGSVTVNFKNEGSKVTGAAKDAIFYDSGEGEQRSIRTKALNHRIVVDDDIKAHMTVDTEYALAGELITLNLDVAVDASSVKINGGTVSLSDVGGGTYTFVMPAGDVNVVAEVAETYFVNLPDHMEIVRTSNPADGEGKYISGTVVEFRLMFPYTTTDVSDGTNTLVAANGVYSVTVETSNINISASINRGNSINLSEATNNFTAVDGDVLSGSTQYTVMVADKANITLSDATIDGGIICDGSATIILDKINSVQGKSQSRRAGIQIGGPGTTLTIKGSGSLTAKGAMLGAGIGLSVASGVDAFGGDIVIESGNVIAYGGQYAAGIGGGDAEVNNIAKLGDIIIKGGQVKAYGGETWKDPVDGIGAGYGSNEIGQIVIYDDIELVDASSIGKDVVYMHGETDVTQNASTYFTIGEDGDHRIITQKDDNDYTITIAGDIEHGSLTGTETAKYMERVTITVTADFGYHLSRLVVKDAENNNVATEGNTFLMPKGNVTVSAIFEQGVHGTTEFTWGYYSGGYVKVASVYDGVTTLYLKQDDGSRYIVNNGRAFQLNNDKLYVDVPYSDGVGTFPKNGASTVFKCVGESGFYDVTLTDLGYDRWSVSILKTVAALDNVPDQTYTGSEIKPEPLVLVGSLNLTKGIDYEYSYTNNVNVGSSATVTVTFKGDYAEFGSVSKSFNITKATPTVEPPTSANPKYAGACVALVTAGSTNFGTMLYSLDDDYSENIPCADKGGDYTVYYKVEESDNWSGAAGSVEIQVPVRVGVTVVGDGSVNGYDPDEFYPVGTVLTLTAEPADGYKFLSWNSDVDVPATFEYTVDAEQNSLEATFSNHYIAYTTSDGDTALPVLSSMYDIKKNKCEDGLCVMFLGDGVTKLESGAFQGNKRLTSIEIPSSIETIGHFAFAETPLIRVDMKSKVPPQLGERLTFLNVPDEYLIHVPHGSADAYRSANGWKDYKDHIVDHDASMLVWTDDAVVPTCSETGWEAGYVCNECHKRFVDVDGHVEMSPVAALGTTYGAVCAYNDDSKAIIDGNSETSVLLPWNIKVDAIELNRTFAAGTISTITLPFSMYVENVEGAVFYRFKYVSSDDWTVHVGSVRDELIANTPYLVKTTGETISFKTGATLERTLDASPTDLGQDEGDGWELRGTYGKMVWKEGHPDLGYVYGFAAENVADVHIGEFVKATAGANLPPMRAYLYYNPVATPAPSPEPSFRGMAPMVRSTSSIETPNYLDVVVDDDEGGTLYIGKLNTRTGEFNAAGDRWFDLKGRKLNGKPSVKGSYFNNKSKVIVK